MGEDGQRGNDWLRAIPSVLQTQFSSFFLISYHHNDIKHHKVNPAPLSNMFGIPFLQQGKIKLLLYKYSKYRDRQVYAINCGKSW